MKKCCKDHNNIDGWIDCGMAGKGNREDSFCCKRCPERLVPVRKALTVKEQQKQPIFMGIQEKLVH